MSAATLPSDTDTLLAGIDRAVEAHLAWNQKLLRCSLLKESPGDDMLRPNAHELCRFGLWLAAFKPHLMIYDAQRVNQITFEHVAMHQAVSTLCSHALAGTVANVKDLLAYEQHQSAMVRLLNDVRQQITDHATHHDVLTGLPLRHGLEHAFDMRSKDARRSGQDLWLVMIDLDRFKSINDMYGHRVGDQALRHATQLLTSSMRENDSLIRFGGEEFLGLFPALDEAGVVQIAQRLVEAMRASPLQTDEGAIVKLTATFGWAKVRPDESLPEATERADYALLQGKTHGRDQYVLAAD